MEEKEMQMSEDKIIKNRKTERKYQIMKRKLEEELDEFSTQELIQRLEREENEDLRTVMSEVLAQKLITGQRVYDTLVLKQAIAQLSLEGLYALSTQQEEIYLSYLASAQMDKILEETFENMHWQKEGEEAVSTTQKGTLPTQKVVPIRAFIQEHVVDEPYYLSSLLKGKVTHTSLMGNASFYQLPLHPVTSMNQNLIEAYQDYLVNVKDEAGKTQLYFNLDDYLQGYLCPKTDESMQYGDLEEEEIALVAHPNRGNYKKVKRMFSRKGNYLKGGCKR